MAYEYITYDYAAKRYQEMAEKMADHIAFWDDFRDTAKNISDKFQDNADVQLDIEEALIKMGVALAAAVEYARGYREDAYKLTHPGGGPSTNQGMAETDNGTTSSKDADPR